MKLKTLKDLDEEWIKKFNIEGPNQPGGGLSDRTQRVWFRDGHEVAHKYTIKELKQEAIKHIKSLEEVTVHDDHELFVRNSGKISWIKQFFNIEEEDLK